MPRIASLSSHGPRGCTLRVTSHYPSSASAGVTVDSGRFWQIVSGQRAREYSECSGSSMKLCSTLFPFCSDFSIGDEACAPISTAPCQMIQDYVSEKFGLSVETCSMAGMKGQGGPHLRGAPNRIDPLKRKYPCPDEHKAAIRGAFVHFGLIRPQQS